MSKSSLIAIITIVVFNSSLNAAEPGPSKDVPELAPLSNWTGIWNAHIEQPAERNGVSQGEWIANGRYLKQTWKIEADDDNEESSGILIMTFDIKQKVYRQWHFVSDGNITESTGEWDDKTRTMTWTNHNEDTGVTTINKDRFPEAGDQHWSIVVSDGSGKTVFEMKGHNTRRKSK